jgi:hypothetical protein
MSASPDDDALLAQLRRIAAEADPVPDAVRAAALAALTTRDLDAELAHLVGDSAVEDAFEPVRAGPIGSRLLSFAGGGVQVDLEISPHGGQVALMGQLTGADETGCTLERAGSAEPVRVDPLGRFLAGPLDRGPIRLRCRSTTGEPVLTAWVAV